MGPVVNVGFLLTAGAGAEGYVLGDHLVQSVRRARLGAPVVQFTDEASPPLGGVDEVRRLPADPLMVLQVRHFAACAGDWLLLDTDAVVQRDVRPVFDDPDFDVAVATREGTLIEGESGSDFMRRMPYNLGVVYSRSPAFWSAVLEWLSAMPPEAQAWMGSQEAGNAVIASGAFRVRVLPCDYNYPPRAADEDVGARAVLHYKGPARKRWLLARAWAEAVA